MGETVLLYSAAAILSACVAALGFKISDESKGGVSITKMVADLAKSAVPGFKVIVGTAAMGLNPGLFYAYMQVVNGKTCVPQNLISWVQNWLSKNGVYDTGDVEYPDYSGITSIKYEPTNTFDYTQLESIFTSKGLDFGFCKEVYSKLLPDGTSRPIEFRVYRQDNLQRWIYELYLWAYTANNTYGVTHIDANDVQNEHYQLGSSVTMLKGYGYIEDSGGRYVTSGFSDARGIYGALTEVNFLKDNIITSVYASNYGSVIYGPNSSGLEAGENVPGKDVVIPGEGTGDVTNEDIVGWLQSAVGAAVASALGIGTASIPFVPVAVKNPAITGDITDALDNVIDQVQDVAQAGATDVDTVATGEKYANTSLAPSKPSGNISASSLYTIWNPSQAQLNNLASFLWSTDFVDTIKKILQSPMDALISLALFPVTPPTDGTHNISLGYIDSGVAAPRVSDQFMTVQTSGLVVPHKYNSYLDYAPYTRAEIFLPFIGFCPLNINDIMGKSVDITYNIDLLSGVCTAIVHANAQSLYSYSGNMAMFLPLSAGNWARMLTPIFGMVGGITSLAAGIGGVMSGAPLLPSTGMAVRGAESIGNMDGNSVSRSSGISGNAGIMGDYQPFIVVTRPINDKPTTYDNNIGQTYNKSAQLGTLSGFTVIEEAHIEGMNATDAEKQEIEQLLKEGVIL
jgi:hypothetical protein